MFTTLLAGWLPASPVRPRPLRRLPDAPSDDLRAGIDTDDAAQAGCGWYESSHDLRAGIDLREVHWGEVARQLDGRVGIA